MTADVVRLATAGSVDDGKSTLIGRLLHDSRAIADDQLVALELASRRRGRGALDLALLTDGLRAEREQGITIDVAYRTFTTRRRRYLLADTPGHVQYTRNMVTGMSTADIAVVLVDAATGPTEQTRRHLAIGALLRVPHVVVAVNKMDIVGYDEARFDEVALDVGRVAARLAASGFEPGDLSVVPISALHGDNVVVPSRRTPWYGGPALLQLLDAMTVRRSVLDGLRFPVQWVIRGTGGDSDYRAYAGRVDAGVARVGDEVVALPDWRPTSIAGIDGPLESAAGAQPPASVAIRLTTDLDLGRGAMLVSPDSIPHPASSLTAMACSLATRPLVRGTRCVVKHTTREVRAVVDEIGPALDLDTLQTDRTVDSLGENEIARVHLRLAEPVFADAYAANRSTGSAIVIDEATNDTIAGLLIETQGVAA